MDLLEGDGFTVQDQLQIMALFRSDGNTVRDLFAFIEKVLQLQSKCIPGTAVGVAKASGAVEVNSGNVDQIAIDSLLAVDQRLGIAQDGGRLRLVADLLMPFFCGGVIDLVKIELCGQLLKTAGAAGGVTGIR